MQINSIQTKLYNKSDSLNNPSWHPLSKYLNVLHIPTTEDMIYRYIQILKTLDWLLTFQYSTK